MRTIKFRAWDTKNNRMIPSVAILGIWEHFVTGFNRDYIHNSMEWDCQDDFTYDYVLEQFTGLLDENGKDIYEGDIVEKNGKQFIIKYNHLHAMWGLFTENAGQSNEEILCDICDEKGNPPKQWTDSTLKVIGNIHEKPAKLNTYFIF